MSNDAQLEKLAESISDDLDVRWKDEESLATTSEGRAWVRNLRVVSDIARCSSDPEGHTLQTVTLDTTPAPEAHLGTWGHLRLIEKIGSGGFGDVYRALDTRLEREVALKLLRPLRQGHESHTVSILREGRLMAKIDHGNVVTVYGAEEHDGRVGIWMEFIRGNPLDNLLKAHGRLGDREAADIGLSVCRALASVHAQGLIHSDIKAQNIMRAEGGRIVLMDFNAARELAVEDIKGSVSGTPLYMPPEAFRGHPATVQGDIYGLGVLLYHLVTGTFPVVADSISGLREAHREGTPKLLRDVRPDLSEGFIAIVERAIADDPQDRFETAGQMQQALAKWMGTEKREEPAPARPKRSWTPAAVVTSLVLAAVISISAILWLRTPATEDSGAVPPTADPATSLPASAVAKGPASPAPGAYSVEAALYRQDGSSTERLVPGARVSVGEELYLEFSGSEDLYVYVLNHDLNGETYVLFPHPQSDLANPLEAGVRHRLPGRSRDSNEDIRWQLTSAGGREQILVMASPQKLEDVEQVLASMPAGEFGVLNANTAIRLRGMGGLVKKPARASDPANSRLFEDVKRLVDNSEQTTGVWMRQIDLENPPAP